MMSKKIHDEKHEGVRAAVRRQYGVVFPAAK
jgi:hypothetical protein